MLTPLDRVIHVQYELVKLLCVCDYDWKCSFIDLTVYADSGL